MIIFPLVAIAAILGLAISSSYKEREKAARNLLVAEPPKALPMLAPPTPAPTTQLIPGKGKSKGKGHRKTGNPKQDIMMKAIEHANATKDPRDYRAAALAAKHAGNPKTAAELAKIASELSGRRVVYVPVAPVVLR